MPATYRYHFKSLASTHLWCQEHQEKIKRLLQDYSLFRITADLQSAGIGRRQSSWQSPQGGLYLSLAFFLQNACPYKIQQKCQKIQLYLLHELCTLLQRYQVPIQAAWPNDLITPEGKLAGMMMSTSYLEKKSFIILSLGCNFYPIYLKKDRSHKRAASCIHNYTTKLSPLELSEYVEEKVLGLLLNELSHLPSPQNFWQNHGLIFPHTYQWIHPQNGLLQKGLIEGMDEVGRLQLIGTDGKLTFLDASLVHKLELLKSS